jgi:hypothetical protein
MLAGVILSVSSSTQQFSPHANRSQFAFAEMSSEGMLVVRKRCMMTRDQTRPSPTPLGRNFPEAVLEGDGGRWACSASTASLRLKAPRTAHSGPKLCRRGTCGGAASVAGTINLVNHRRTSMGAVTAAQMRHYIDHEYPRPP